MLSLIEDQPAAEVLPGNFARADDAPELVPLSPARPELRRCITKIAACNREVESTGLPPQRCRDTMAAFDRPR